MAYFDGITFLSYDHLQNCAAWIDREFPDFYAINFCFGGAIRWQNAQGDMLTLPAPVCWWTWPGTRFVYGALPDSSWNHYYTAFAGPRVQRMLREGLLQRNREQSWVMIPDPQQFAGRWDELLAALRARGPDLSLAIHILEGLFLTVAAAQQQKRQPAVNDRLNDLLTVIRQKPERHWNFQHQAAQLDMSYVHFCRLIKQITGHPPQRFVTRCRIERAATLLHNRDVPIKAVAGAVGYEDVFHFIHAFGAHFGIPPGRYRDSVAKLHSAPRAIHP